jgi:hypothetical protein
MAPQALGYVYSKQMSPLTHQTRSAAATPATQPRQSTTCLHPPRAPRGPSAAPHAAGPHSALDPDPEEVVYATFRWPTQLGGDDIRVSGARAWGGARDWRGAHLQTVAGRKWGCFVPPLIRRHRAALSSSHAANPSAHNVNRGPKPPAGSWDDWSSQSSLIPVAKDGQQVRSPVTGDAVRTLLVPRGVHDYKYIVDDKWRPAPTDPVARDQAVGLWVFILGGWNGGALAKGRRRRRRDSSGSCSSSAHSSNQPQGATNNKRLLTGTGNISFKGRRELEVLVIGDWSDWTVSRGWGWVDDGCGLWYMMRVAAAALGWLDHDGMPCSW